MVTAANPVGVFDSGVGGLSVLRAIRVELPHENLLYVADSAYAPYGDRPAGYIENRATAVAQFLIAERAKAIVVACNTATGIAALLRQAWEIGDLAMVRFEPLGPR